MISLSAFFTPPVAGPLRHRRRTMTAVQMIAPGQFETRRLSLPKPGPGEVRIRLEGCGVSALPAGCNNALPPGAPGCEGWGQIEALGPDVEGWVAGERVAFLGGNAYATHTLADAETLARLPESGAPFASPLLAGAVHLFRQARIAKGERVAVLGCGFLGLLLIQLAVLAQARVIAFSRRPYALGLAREAGAEAAYPLCSPEAAVHAAHGWSQGHLCRLAIEATGHEAPLSLAARLLQPGGRLLIGGSHDDGARAVDLGLWRERAVRLIPSHPGDAAQQRDCLREAASAVRAGLMTPLYTHRFPLERLDEAHQLAATRPEGFLKAWVDLTP